MDPPAPPDPAAPRPPATPTAPPSLHLAYATPQPPARRPFGPDDPILRVLRQIVFSVGLALLMFGLTSALGKIYLRDAPYFAAWGAGFMGLATPLWRVRKDRD